MGQARHMVFLFPCGRRPSTSTCTSPMPQHRQALVAGKVFHRPAGGFVGVANVGLDDDWAGNHLSMANLYGFGRLAWDPDLSARRLAEEWTRLTFGDDPKWPRPSLAPSSVRGAPTRTTPGRSATDPYRHHRRSLWSRRRSLRAQRLGTVAQRRRKGRRHGPHRGHGHRFHRSVPPRSGPPVRIAGHLSGRSAAIPAPRSLHLQAALRQDRIQYIYDSHYEGADAVAGYAEPGSRSRGASTTSGMARCWRNWSIRPAKPGFGAMPSRCGFCAPPASPMPRAAWATTQAVSRRSRWRSRATPSGMVVPWEAASGGKSRRMRRGEVRGHAAFDGAPGWYTLHGPVFRPARRRLPLSRAGGEPACR